MSAFIPFYLFTVVFSTWATVFFERVHLLCILYSRCQCPFKPCPSPMRRCGRSTSSVGTLMCVCVRSTSSVGTLMCVCDMRCGARPGCSTGMVATRDRRARYVREPRHRKRCCDTSGRQLWWRRGRWRTGVQRRRRCCRGRLHRPRTRTCDRCQQCKQCRWRCYCNTAHHTCDPNDARGTLNRLLRCLNCMLDLRPLRSSF